MTTNRGRPRGKPAARRPGRGPRRVERRHWWIAGGAVLVVAVVIVAVLLLLTEGKSPPKALAPTTAALGIPGTTGAPVDGVQCQTTEQVAYHIHAHLTLIVDGADVPIPAGIGIAPPRVETAGFVTGGSCFYWLHTHDATGVIHIESPTPQMYTLGQFFAVWGQPLSASQVAGFPVTSARPLHVFVDGQAYSGSPDQIVLGAHTLITIELGPQTPPPGFTFPAGL